MRALVYKGPGERGWDTVDDPKIIDPTDVIVRIDTATICGTACTSSRATSPRPARARSSAMRPWARFRRWAQV